MSEPRLRTYEVLPSTLWIGPRSHEVPAAEKGIFARSTGLQAVFNLWHMADYDWAEGGLSYCHVPLPDGKIVDESAYNRLVNLGEMFLQKGQPMLIQCYGGRNRSGLLAALLVRRMTGATGRQAIAIVQRARPSALANEHFRTYLESLK
jgi:protein-tyrosine phosphatase